MKCGQIYEAICLFVFFHEKSHSLINFMAQITLQYDKLLKILRIWTFFPFSLPLSPQKKNWHLNKSYSANHIPRQLTFFNEFLKCEYIPDNPFKNSLNPTCHQTNSLAFRLSSICKSATFLHNNSLAFVKEKIKSSTKFVIQSYWLFVIFLNSFKITDQNIK